MVTSEGVQSAQKRAAGRRTEDVDATELIEDMFAMVLQ